MITATKTNIITEQNGLRVFVSFSNGVNKQYIANFNDSVGDVEARIEEDRLLEEEKEQKIEDLKNQLMN